MNALKSSLMLGMMATAALAGCNGANTGGTAPSGAQGGVSGGAQGGAQGSGAAPAAPSASRPGLPAPGYVRAVHVVPGIQSLAVDVKPSPNSDSGSILVGLDYGSSASSFSALQPGKLKIYAKSKDGKTSLAGPMPVNLDKGEDVTVVVNGVPGDVAMLPFEHKNGGPAANKGKIAFLHAAMPCPKWMS